MNTALVITSIGNDRNRILQLFASQTAERKIKFILIGDAKSPKEFNLGGCDFYSIYRQRAQSFKLARILPENHYARKNLGYLIAMANDAEIIIETDDDNFPLNDFWNARSIKARAYELTETNWVNVYRYFTDTHIWPRGFPLKNIHNELPPLKIESIAYCPIQQGLADDNPDVDALYRLIYPLPVQFKKFSNIALGNNSFCPFNSQNTSWFKEAFPLLYLPSYCSFRMTDIWRSFIAQRIAWTCGWSVLFHESTVKQKRNEHNLKKDLEDELCGYMYNEEMCEKLGNLKLFDGINNIPVNMIICYEKLIEFGIFDIKEMILLRAWLEDINCLKA